MSCYKMYYTYLKSLNSVLPEFQGLVRFALLYELCTKNCHVNYVHGESELEFII